MELRKQDTSPIGQHSEKLHISWLNQGTALLTINSTHEVLLLLPPKYLKQSPFLAMSPSMIHYLNCPSDLLYAKDREKLLAQAAHFPEIRKRGFQPVELDTILNSELKDDQSLQDIIRQISLFVQKYAVPPPSLVYRFPRLTGWKTPFKLIALIFCFKLVFLSLIQREYNDNFPFNYTQDFQFHRRWQEVTSVLPYEEWYTFSSVNPKFYYNMDCPPIAAYFHMLLGTSITKKIVPEAVLFSTLNFKAGTPCEDIPGIRIDRSATEEYFDEDGTAVFPLQASHFFKSHKYFILLRICFALMDVLSVGLASLSLVQYYWARMNPRLRYVAFLSLNFLLLAIYFDHCDTQINFLYISLFLLSFRFALSENFAVSASLAIITFLTKQNTLVFFVPFGILVLAKFYRRLLAGQIQSVLFELAGILFSVSLTLVLCLWPFLNPESLSQVYKSVFPFGRGVFQTALPTLWPFIHKIIWVRSVNSWFLLPICTVLVLLSSSKSMIRLAITPTNSNFVLTIQQCALCFFLFGYEIHEKNIMWYVLTLHFSLFEFPVSPLSFINLFSVLLLSPIFVEFGTRKVAALFYLILLFQHSLLKSLPHPPIEDQHSNGAKVSRFLSKLLPYFQVYVGIHSVMYFVDQGGQMNKVMHFASFQLIFGIELALISYHNSLMHQHRPNQVRPYSHLKQI